MRSQNRKKTIEIHAVRIEAVVEWSLPPAEVKISLGHGPEYIAW